MVMALCLQAAPDTPTYRYALVHEGHLYPPKYLLHRIVGIGRVMRDA